MIILFSLLPLLACTAIKYTPQPRATRVIVKPLAFEIETITPTVSVFADVPTYTPDPKARVTRRVSSAVTAKTKQNKTATPKATSTSVPPLPTNTPTLVPTSAPAEPLQGGAWDFEAGFSEWANPYGDICPASNLAVGWTAFTTRDQFGSSCMNQTTWADNVFSGENAQEITFAYVGVQAGVFRTAPTMPGHKYTVTAYMRREFSVEKVVVSLGIDTTGGGDWQAETTQWFSWNEDFDNEWSKTEQTVTAETENMTIFIRGTHLYPEPGGTLRIDNITVVDIGAGE